MFLDPLDQGLGTVRICFQPLAWEWGWGELAFGACAFVVSELLAGIQVSAWALSVKRLKMEQTIWRKSFLCGLNVLDAGGWSSCLFQNLLRAYFSATGAGTFPICIDCSLQLLAAHLALDLAVGGQVFGIVIWAKWLGRAQSNSWRGDLGKALGSLWCL